jgi:hypothetical protein
VHNSFRPAVAKRTQHATGALSILRAPKARAGFCPTPTTGWVPSPSLGTLSVGRTRRISTHPNSLAAADYADVFSRATRSRDSGEHSGSGGAAATDRAARPQGGSSIGQPGVSLRHRAARNAFHAVRKPAAREIARCCGRSIILRNAVPDRRPVRSYRSDPASSRIRHFRAAVQQRADRPRHPRRTNSRRGPRVRPTIIRRTRRTISRSIPLSAAGGAGHVTDLKKPRGRLRPPGDRVGFFRDLFSLSPARRRSIVRGA